MLGNKKGKMICGYVPDYVLFDLETTGTSCIYDEVIEISAVKVRSGKVVEEFSQLVNPKRPIPYAASMVNHISDEMVANEPDFGQVLPEFLTFAGCKALFPGVAAQETQRSCRALWNFNKRCTQGADRL